MLTRFFRKFSVEVQNNFFISRGIFSDLTRRFKKISAELSKNCRAIFSCAIFGNLTRASKKIPAELLKNCRVVFAVIFPALLFFAYPSAGISIDEKAERAARYFAENFAIFIPEGGAVGVREFVPDETGEFYSGVFVFNSASGSGRTAPVPFLLTSDARRLIVGATGPFDAGDLESSGVRGFGIVPDSVKSAPLILFSKDGRAIAAERVMDTEVDYRLRTEQQISLDGSPVVGAENAPVTIVEYSDFQCPYCARASHLIEDILARYGSEARLVYKHLPLSFHNWAYQAASASVCFHKRGGNRAFRIFHDEIFAGQQEITKDNHRERFSRIAERAHLSAREIFRCMDSGEAAEIISRDLDEAKTLGVNGTPTFFVDGIRVPADFDLLKKAVDIRLSAEK